MIHTAYSIIDTDELIAFTMTKSGASDLEVELAQRLTLAIDMLAEYEEDEDEQDPGGTSQRCH
jgi:hypothetical protein